ncbi:Rieske 2Fe-2S domain-containing protein [Nocardioides sp. CBS4Y-1]|uniref:Rieske 2Fe-2S domain-containing protein n=2 Tax=Nocardioides acrostichi TaxID=2784339 RepID=A0A930USY7_9ACTN|nr:Rieske 2Fe-2S domain-containing protein [Nocardioides acrostichi]
MPRRDRLEPTWRDARPERIRRSLDAALARDPGGWYCVGDRRALRERSVVRVVGGREVVLWRTSDGVAAGSGSCPHLGALLDDCEVHGDRLRCRWHGLALQPGGQPGWPGFEALDDGVLLWVRLPTAGEADLPAPRLTRRPDPARSVAAVVEVAGACEPRDVVANRLDPWHGSWFHPYAFSHLEVDEQASDDDLLTVDVTYRLSRRWGVPVRAEFACPDARTIVMTITEGEGAGSVVETHATPLGPGPDGRGRTMVVEATIATSDRPGFQVARRAAGLMRPGMRVAARRLWVDDMTYAERSALLRIRGEDHGI